MAILGDCDIEDWWAVGWECEMGDRGGKFAVTGEVYGPGKYFRGSTDDDDG